MYYIGYILGIIFIIWLISRLISAKSRKKDGGASDGTSSTAAAPAGGGIESKSDKETPLEPGPSKDPAGSDEGSFIKAPDDMDLSTPPGSGTGKDSSSEKESPEKEKTPGTYSSEKEKTPGPTVRSGTDEADASDEKKTVILYREETGKYRKRCPYCNTYMTSGNPVCEVCGSKVSA